jgi:hypothetical protein
MVCLLSYFFRSAHRYIPENRKRDPGEKKKVFEEGTIVQELIYVV